MFWYVFWQIAEEENLEFDSKFRALVAIGSMVFFFFFVVVMLTVVFAS